MDEKKEIKNFARQFAKLGDKKWGEGAKRYLKSPFYFFGVRSADIQALAKSFFNCHKDLSLAEVQTLTWALWNSDCHEKRILAIRLLERYSALLDRSSWPLLEKMLGTSMNWDQVDEISIHLVGVVLKKDFSFGKKYLLRWSQEKNFWLRRASLIAQLLLFRKNLGDKKLFFTLAQKMLDENKYPRECFVSDYFDEKMGKFFIRKAIGWVLRDLSAKDPQAVVNFLNKNWQRASGLTYREGSRRLPSVYKKKLKK